MKIKKVNEMKTFVYSYNHNGKIYYWYTDDVNGDSLVSDINDARVFTEKQIISFGLDSAFSIDDEIYCDELDEYITLTSKPIKIEL